MAGTGTQLLKYTLLPGFIPRIGALASSGFTHIAYFMALIYQTVRLLPPTHPYLNPQNIGKYGIRHVVAEAANNLTLSRKNIDQILVFSILLAGLVLLLLQFVLLALAVFAQPVMAFGLTPLTDWFTTPSSLTCNTTGIGVPFCVGPEQDIAFILMDRIFGLEGIYNSCVSTLVPCLDMNGNPYPTPAGYPYPFHSALHQLLMYYTYGIAFVSVIVIVYFVITIAGETAATGIPFGQRFNKSWAVLRLIVFFALLAPISMEGGRNAGLNGAQLITFWTAKFGSNMATNMWARFNIVLTSETFLGAREELIATPNIPEIGALSQFFFVAKACQIAETVVHGAFVRPFIVRSFNPTAGVDPETGVTSAMQLVAGMPLDAVLQFVDNGNITIRFGEFNPPDGVATSFVNPPGAYGKYQGFVKPSCGEITVHVTDVAEPGSREILSTYLDILVEMWYNPLNGQVADCHSRGILPVDPDPLCALQPDSTIAIVLNNIYEANIRARLLFAIDEQIANGNFTAPEELLAKGWAGAAIWYNRIAKMNGAVTTAVFNIPRPHKYPLVMEQIADSHKQNDENVPNFARFDPLLSNGTPVDLPREGDKYIASSLYSAYMFFEDGRIGQNQYTEASGNIVLDGINAILGTSGLFDLRYNATAHPLAQLSSLGKGMIEATIRNLAMATAGVVADGLGGLLEPFGKLAGTASGFLWSFAMMSMTIGFILFYILPLMPFIYFMFAVSGWVKSIFEAIVAMPLWALAHVRIDGEGLPGPAATSGYALLLEIFLRPSMIVFGLIASIVIFSSMVVVLNDVFELVVANAGGFNNQCMLDPGSCPGAPPVDSSYYRSTLDEFFYTVIYAIIVYMIGMSCFKLVDLIPNNIMRWAGIAVATFQENAGDPAGKLTQGVYSKSILFGNQLQGAIARSKGQDPGHNTDFAVISNLNR